MDSWKDLRIAVDLPKVYQRAVACGHEAE
jgi:hypothetical protein